MKCINKTQDIFDLNEKAYCCSYVVFFVILIFINSDDHTTSIWIFVVTNLYIKLWYANGNKILILFNLPLRLASDIIPICT